MTESGKEFSEQKINEMSDYEKKGLVKKYINVGDYRKQNDFFDYFSKKGYDVLVDEVDNFDDNNTGAMIFLKPYESLKLTDVYTQFSKEDGKFIEHVIENAGGIEAARNAGQLDKFKVG